MFFGGVAFSEVPISDDGLSSRNDRPSGPVVIFFNKGFLTFTLDINRFIERSLSFNDLNEYSLNINTSTDYALNFNLMQEKDLKINSVINFTAER
jgi:hypothetical protein